MNVANSGGGTGSLGTDSLESKLKKFTPYPVDNFSVARLMLLPTIYDRVFSDKSDVEFNSEDYDGLRTRLRNKQTIDFENCTRKSLVDILGGLDDLPEGFTREELSSTILNVKEHISSGAKGIHHFGNKLDFFDYLSSRAESNKTFESLENGQFYRDTIDEHINSSRDFLQREPLDMYLIDFREIFGDNLGDLPEIVTFRKKSEESLMFKMLDRISRFYKSTLDQPDKLEEIIGEVVDENSGETLFNQWENGSSLEGLISSGNLSGSDIRDFMYKSFLGNVFESGIDYYKFFEGGVEDKFVYRKSVNIDGEERILRFNLLTPKFGEMVSDLFLIDSAGFKIITSDKGKIDKYQEIVVNQSKKSSSENSDLRYLPLLSRTQRNDVKEKDGSFTIGLTSSEYESSYSEGKVQDLLGLYESEFGIGSLEAHTHYKRNNAGNVYNRIKRDNEDGGTGDLSTYLSRLSEIFEIDGEKLLLEYSNKDPRGYYNS